MRPGYRFALAAAASFVLLAYKGLAIVPLSPGPVLLGWALETALLVSVAVASELGRAQAPRVVRASAALGFYAVFYAVVVCSLAHTLFFESAAERRFSLLELQPGALVVFFRDVLPLRGALLLGSLLAAIHLLALGVGRLTGTLRHARVVALLLAGWVALAIALSLRPRVPSPVADMAATVWEELTTPEVKVDRERPPRHAPAQLDASGTPEPKGRFAYDKVLVFVMETMTADTFERERQALPRSAFVNRAAESGQIYTRYFANNQDSRTGMLAMLGSRFIPHESYTEEGRDAYMFLARKSSLVDAFRARGYHTAFAVSQQEIELVVGDLPWDTRAHLAEGEPERLRSSYLCFVPYEFEHSCEDRALLPRVLALIDRHERLFLYQEFIWGHASEYNQASGKTNTAYYSEYLDAVLAHLAERGTLDETLIVLTSDHGFRDKGLQSQRSVYELPLLFHARGRPPAQDDRLFSHLDFKDLLLHQLVPGSPAPRESPFVMIVGPTGTRFLTVVTQPGAFLLMKTRGDARYLVHADGISGERATRTASDFLRLFDDYLAGFSRI